MDLFCRIQVTDNLELIGMLMITILGDEKFPFSERFCCNSFLFQVCPISPWPSGRIFPHLSCSFPILFFPCFSWRWHIPSLSLLLISHIHDYLMRNFQLGAENCVCRWWRMGIVVFSWNGELCLIAEVIRVWLKEEPIVGNETSRNLERANFREWNQQNSEFYMNKY